MGNSLTISHMKLTEEMRRAALRWVSQPGESRRSLARALGVSHSTVVRWLRDRKISEEHWLLLEPLLERFRPSKAGRLEVREEPAGYEFRGGGELSAVDGEELRRVPVLGIARAASFQAALGADALADEFGGDSEVWSMLPAGHLRFRVDGRSGLPHVQPGGVVQVDFNRLPRSGEFCVAMTSVSEFPLLKHYYRKNYRVLLASANGEDGEDYEFDLKKEDGERVYWAHPVVDIMRGGGVSMPAPAGWLQGSGSGIGGSDHGPEECRGCLR